MSQKVYALSVVAFSAASFVAPCLAQQSTAYPVKPVRIVSPFAPGGGSDLMARTLAIEFAKDMKETFVVDNRTGGNGNIGTDIVARGAPDGYTLLLTTNATVVINPQLFTKVVTYDPVRDLSPISLVASQPFVLVLHPSVAAKTVPELIALAKAKPGTLNYASSGSGGGAHLAGEMLKTFAGVDITHVPYKGSNPGLTALVGGQVQFMFVAVLAAMPLIEQNKLRAIAVSTTKRNPALPNLPAVSEFPGLEQFNSDLWYGLLAPGKTPHAIVDKLYGAVRTVLARPEVKSRFEPSGTVLVGSSPKQFAETIRQDIARWGNVIKAAKVSPEY
jgi:tripartite-type tricarboxylate transporter receptor subunit TctC